MKILCLSDKVDPLVDSTGIRERFGDADLVLGAGDLPMDYLSYVVSALDRPLLFVFGNHNLSALPYFRPERDSTIRPFDDYDRYGGATYIGFKIRKECDLIIMGLGGSIKYNNDPNQFSQAQMWIKVLAKVPALLLNRLRFGRSVDIVLTHAAPRGVNDGPDLCHRGFDAFLWLMRVFKPRYLVHGHVHLYDARESRESTYQGTIVVNAYGHHIIDTGDDRA